MRRGTIGVVSLHEDPHARIVRGLIERDFDRPCQIIPVDRIADSGVLDWSPQGEHETPLPTIHGAPLTASSLSALWWRRAGAQSVVPSTVSDPAALAQISDDCVNALGSVMRAEFRGAWVSHPEATRLAEYKVLQLKVAHAVGLRMPRTLISQNPDRIREFHSACGGRVVVKPLTTRLNAGVSAGRLKAELLHDTEALRLSPAIYQEWIPGTRHLRVHMFGARALTATIEAEELDWRFHLGAATFTPTTLDPALENALHEVLVRLDLRMGIFDLKLDADGSPTWLEVNPQGQFLFLEALCDLPLSAAMARFLVDEAQAYEQRLA